MAPAVDTQLNQVFHTHFHHISVRNKGLHQQSHYWFVMLRRSCRLLRIFVLIQEECSYLKRTGPGSLVLYSGTVILRYASGITEIMWRVDKRFVNHIFVWCDESQGETLMINEAS